MASTLPFLPQVQIVEVIESSEVSRYLQQVQIVEAYDENQDPWRPVVFDPLEVVTKSSTTGSTTLGSKLTGTPAVFSGGEPPVEPVSQWQRSADGNSWSGITPWADTTEQQTYTTVLADNGQYVRFASKCTDANGVVYGSGNNIGPMAPQAIAVSEPTIMTNGTFSNPTNAYLHETLTMYPATMVGGYGTISYKYRLQEQEQGVGDWSNLTQWSTTIPTHEVDQSDEGDKLRFQTQGTDETGQTKTSNSGVTTVAVSTLIGTVSIGPSDALTADPAEMVGFTASNDGDADPMFIWAIRNGPATITSTYNFGPSVEVTVNADASSGDTVQVQVTADDPSATDTPQGSIATIVVN